MGCLKILQGRKDCPQSVKNVIRDWRQNRHIDGERVLDAFRDLEDVMDELDYTPKKRRPRW